MFDEYEFTVLNASQRWESFEKPVVLLRKRNKDQDRRNATSVIVHDFPQLRQTNLPQPFKHKIRKIANCFVTTSKARRALDALDRGGGKIIAFADLTERMQAMAKDYAAMSPKDQRSTIVIDPSRAGRDALNAKIRIQLVASGKLTGEAVTMRTLESKGLTKAEARDARSYEVGDVVRFARDCADKGIVKREAVTVKGIDPVKNAVSLEKANGNTFIGDPGNGAHPKARLSPLAALR
jgi:hypothetical protein